MVFEGRWFLPIEVLLLRLEALIVHLVLKHIVLQAALGRIQILLVIHGSSHCLLKGLDLTYRLSNGVPHLLPQGSLLLEVIVLVQEILKVLLVETFEFVVALLQAAYPFQVRDYMLDAAFDRHSGVPHVVYDHVEEQFTVLQLAPQLLKLGTLIDVFKDAPRHGFVFFVEQVVVQEAIADAEAFLLGDLAFVIVDAQLLVQLVRARLVGLCLLQASTGGVALALGEHKLVLLDVARRGVRPVLVCGDVRDAGLRVSEHGFNLVCMD